MKRCFKCKKDKDLSDFYVHEQMADGYLGKCKDCTKKDATNHRNKNIEKIRAYDRERGKLPHRILLNKHRTKWYRKHNPEKYAAHTLLAYAVRSGKVKKPKKCSKCDTKTIIHGHHEDYYAPLKVIWLCQVCHKQLHKEKRNGISKNQEISIVGNIKEESRSSQSYI